jgi:hypothetical protein
MNKDLKIPFDVPLHELDPETQTYGCRQKNPDICGNNSLPGVCAFHGRLYLSEAIEDVERAICSSQDSSS